MSARKTRLISCNYQPPPFTGKERDEETGYGYFGARYMDHELTAMWLSVDPMADKYPGISPYAYCAWNPVRLVDPDGREIFINIDGTRYYLKIEEGNNISWQSKDGETYSPAEGSWTGNLTSAIEILISSKTANALISELVNNENELEIKSGNNNNYDPMGTFIHWNGKSGTYGSTMYMNEDGDVWYTQKPEICPMEIGLIHELAHINDVWNNIVSDREGVWDSYTKKDGTRGKIKNAEKYSCFIENKVRSEMNLPKRRYYYYNSRTGESAGDIWDYIFNEF